MGMNTPKAHACSLPLKKKYCKNAASLKSEDRNEKTTYSGLLIFSIKIVILQSTKNNFSSDETFF